MKAFVVCAAFLVSAVQASPADSLGHAAVRAKWSSFKAQHKKAYSPSEENLRMATYLDNTRVIEEHNARFHQGLESYELGHNEFSDLSLEEIQSTRMGLVLPPNAAEIMANASHHFVPSDVAAPSNVDWRQKNGCVQKVKNQGSCGSCYTFSAIGALETAHCNKYRQLLDLSEQHLVDCGGRGCSGGWMHDMFNYLQRNGGSPLQSQYGYTGRVGTCDNNKQKSVRVASYKQVPRGDENALLHAIASVGTVSIAYNAGTQAHAYYRGGILDVANCGNNPTHAVLLVGYGTENGKDFWTLKNSWGESWGEKGYFRLARGKNMCGIADWASYPTAV